MNVFHVTLILKASLIKKLVWIIVKIRHVVVKISIFVFLQKQNRIFLSSMLLKTNGRENSNVHNFLLDLHNNPSTSFKYLEAFNKKNKNMYKPCGT